MAVITKVVTWILANGATLIGVLQALVKAIKEIVTGVVNLISLFTTKDIAEGMVTNVRWALNKVDAVLELAKGYLLK